MTQVEESLAPNRSYNPISLERLFEEVEPPHYQVGDRGLGKTISSPR